jgi:hypothetical protein
MRAEVARHFDVVVVVWVLALAVGFSFALLSHARLSGDQWTNQQPASHWVYQNN